MTRSIPSLVSTILRDPVSLLDRASTPDALAHLAPRLLGVTIVAGAIFGAVVGSYRGGLQIAYAGAKMPALLLIPALVALPAVRALWQAAEVEVPYPRIALATLVGAARTAVLAAALGPVLWLVYSVSPGYHLSVLLLAATLALVGLPGLAVVGRAVPSTGLRGWLAIGASVVVLGLTTAQTGWLLRPFVARPTAEVSFLRPVEEDVFSSVTATALSAVGVYPGWEAEPAGLLGRARKEAR